MRSSLALLPLATLLALSACSAPRAEVACADFCDNIEICGLLGGADDGRCMWQCLAGVEWREQKGDRCGRLHRREIACLARVDDCEFLLEDRTYDQGDPCAPEGGNRSNACTEDGLRGSDLVPLSADFVDLMRADTSTEVPPYDDE